MISKLEQAEARIDVMREEGNKVTIHLWPFDEDLGYSFTARVEVFPAGMYDTQMIAANGDTFVQAVEEAYIAYRKAKIEEGLA